MTWSLWGGFPIANKRLCYEKGIENELFCGVDRLMTNYSRKRFEALFSG